MPAYGRPAAKIQTRIRRASQPPIASPAPLSQASDAPLLPLAICSLDVGGRLSLRSRRKQCRLELDEAEYVESFLM